MPSLTVVVSSDTDICFSPGLYGDCLPTLQPSGPRIHSGPSACRSIHARTPVGRGDASHRHYGHRQSDVNRI
ncbi:hypothetical protein GTY51_20565 [Streptomyces sp. SID4936]|nr:hypothetical protein [Streptomyces sp. SID4936]